MIKQMVNKIYLEQQLIKRVVKIIPLINYQFQFVRASKYFINIMSTDPSSVRQVSQSQELIFSKEVPKSSKKMSQTSQNQVSIVSEESFLSSQGGSGIYKIKRSLLEPVQIESPAYNSRMRRKTNREQRSKRHGEHHREHRREHQREQHRERHRVQRREQLREQPIVQMMPPEMLRSLQNKNQVINIIDDPSEILQDLIEDVNDMRENIQQRQDRNKNFGYSTVEDSNPQIQQSSESNYGSKKKYLKQREGRDKKFASLTHSGINIGIEQSSGSNLDHMNKYLEQRQDRKNKFSSKFSQRGKSQQDEFHQSRPQQIKTKRTQMKSRQNIVKEVISLQQQPKLIELGEDEYNIIKEDQNKPDLKQIKKIIKKSGIIARATEQKVNAVFKHVSRISRNVQDSLKTALWYSTKAQQQCQSFYHKQRQFFSYHDKKFRKFLKLEQKMNQMFQFYEKNKAKFQKLKRNLEEGFEGQQKRQESEPSNILQSEEKQPQVNSSFSSGSSGSLVQETQSHSRYSYLFSESSSEQRQNKEVKVSRKKKSSKKQQRSSSSQSSQPVQKLSSDLSDSEDIQQLQKKEKKKMQMKKKNEEQCNIYQYQNKSQESENLRSQKSDLIAEQSIEQNKQFLSRVINPNIQPQYWQTSFQKVLHSIKKDSKNKKPPQPTPQQPLPLSHPLPLPHSLPHSLPPSLPLPLPIPRSKHLKYEFSPIDKFLQTQITDLDTISALSQDSNKKLVTVLTEFNHQFNLHKINFYVRSVQCWIGVGICDLQLVRKNKFFLKANQFGEHGVYMLGNDGIVLSNYKQQDNQAKKGFCYKNTDFVHVHLDSSRNVVSFIKQGDQFSKFEIQYNPSLTLGRIRFCVGICMTRDIVSIQNLRYREDN